MEPHVLSVNVGGPRLQRVPKGKATGIAKRPVDVVAVADPGPKRVEDGHGVSGVEGDFIGNGRHHGGSDQAVYAFAREELDHWASALGRELEPGLFGENLTTQGLEVDAAEIGDLWRVGGATLRVAGPRVPCATFAEAMGERGWVRRFAERGRAGAYLAVVTPGSIRPGDSITVEPGGSGIDVPTALRALLGDHEAARRVVEAKVLAEPHHGKLAATLE